MPDSNVSTEKQKDLKASVQKFASDLAEKVESFVTDISELEVRTYTITEGKFAAVLDDPKKKNDKVLSGEGVQLRAYTRIAFDSDTIVCLPVNESGQIDGAVWDMHQAAVNQALQNRAAMLRAIGDAAASALDALKKSR
ncbi:MAG TPA: hypothetical protein PLJ78_07865 [Anaerolineae bacterium]|nr:hypothetical protein [Anaerolineae bacterium]HQK13841.1 hypothetical protein [Anaerolineae bacterium]